MKNRHRTTTACFLFGALAVAAGAQEGRQGDFVGRLAGLRFALPAGSQVFEREIFLDDAGATPSSMILLRVVPEDLTEESSLLATQVSIEVFGSVRATLEDWAASSCPGAESEAWQERRTVVAGRPSLRRERRDSELTAATQVLLVDGSRGYRFSARGSANEALLQAILDGVQLVTPRVSADAGPTDGGQVAMLASPEVRMVYLVPSDRAHDAAFRLGMEKAIRELQVFYRAQIGTGRTFSLHAPVVEVVPTSHPVAWYTTNAPASSAEGRFWESVLADGFALLGGGFNDPSNRWVFYIDADPLCNQYVGGTSGVALLPANDFRGLTCGVNVPPCGGPGDNGALCRWVGGLGHELGHAFNLPHPVVGSCPAPDPNCNTALMWTGYATFPTAYLLPSDVQSLTTSPSTAQFFTPLDPGPLATTCSAGCGVAPMAMVVDATGNGVLEPNGVAAVMAPTWMNVSSTVAIGSLTGALAAFTGPTGPVYSILDGGADYGPLAPRASAPCTANCYALSVSGSRPSLHWDAQMTEAVSAGAGKTWTVHVGGSFGDVAQSSPYYRFVEAILHKGVTGGCSATDYCPASFATREQMAVFMLVAKHGAGFSPPACGAPVFADVPASSPFCRFIEELARRGIVGGCGGGNYCPGTAVTREQMAVFLLLTQDQTLNPPACGTPVFADVPASSPFCRFIEELARRGIASGCGGGNYCPTSPVTREQMAVFLAATFGLALYGP